MPTINEDKLKEFKDNLIQLSEGITKPDFVKSFKHLLKIVTRIEQELIKKVNQALINLNDDHKTLKNATNGSLSDFTAKHGQSLDKALKEQEDALNFIRDKVRKIKEGVDGKEGKQGEPGKDGKDGKNAESFTPEQIRDLFELLDGDERPDIGSIRGLRRLLAKLEERPLGKGGGFSYIHLQRHILDNQTFVGTQNGTNKDFTVTREPNPPASLKIYRGGARQRSTEDYTVSGRTVSFIVAPVADEVLFYDMMF